jgi:hypothetical protein
VRYGGWRRVAYVQKAAAAAPAGEEGKAAPRIYYGCSNFTWLAAAAAPAVLHAPRRHRSTEPVVSHYCAADAEQHMGKRRHYF